MSSSVANFKPVAAGLTLALLAAGTLLLRPLEQAVELTAWAERRPATRRAASPGHAGIWGVLGGMRAIVAGGFWLRANLAWERRDAAATTELIGLTVAADERPLYFWLNGARMLAYDLPEWSGAVPAAVRQRAVGQHARQALEFLEKGLRWHGAEAALYVEMGNIHLRCTGDLERAARCYRLAAEQSGAPYYAARIHGELLRRLGRPGEALDWLRQVLPGLSADDPAAGRELVLARIQALERAVGAK